MKQTCLGFKVLFLLSFFTATAQSQDTAHAVLVTKNPTDEAVILYRYIHQISGKQTLAGQHSVPLLGSARLAAVYKATHQYPAVFGQDFGFSFPGDWDGINFRQQLVDEAIKRNNEGFIITLMWHAVPPTMDEPVSFEKGIQSHLTDAEWKELVTPGSRINLRWQSQVDVIAFFLKQLQYAHVPVLWRPYHEMNGDWFWWGGRTEGQYTTAALYRQLFDRFVHYHHLKNLLWLWSVDRVSKPGMEHVKFFPGIDYVDVLGLDVYR